MHNINSESSRAVNSARTFLLDMVCFHTNEATSSSDLLDDGRYISNHVLHPKGEREREIEIKNGTVIVEDCHFSQSSFFEVNVIVRKIAD